MGRGTSFALLSLLLYFLFCSFFFDREAGLWRQADRSARPTPCRLVLLGVRWGLALIGWAG